MILKKRIGNFTVVALPIKMKLWKPREQFLPKICEKLKKYVNTGDFVVFSEKALSVALGNIYDENKLKVSWLSKAIGFIVMNIMWGYFLGKISKLKDETLKWIRKAPLSEIAAHKQLSLKVGGILQMLKPSSEAGIDTSNLPYSYVSLPLTKCSLVHKLRKGLEKCLGKKISVIIVDSDRTYVHRRLDIALASRSTCVKGLRNYGVVSYIVGRAFRTAFYPRATPIMYSGVKINLRLLLEISELADKVRGYGAGRTVFEMAERFHTNIEGITWDMLSSIPHYPVVIVKFIRRKLS